MAPGSYSLPPPRTENGGHRPKTGDTENGAGSPWGIAPPGLPQIQTCGFPASGSSRRGFAVPHTIRSPCGDTLRGSMPSTWFRSPGHNAAPPSLHGVQEGPFPRFITTMGRSDPRPSLSPCFVIARRYHPCALFAPSGRDARPWAPGSWYSGSRAGSCRWRRTGLPGSWESLVIIVRVHSTPAGSGAFCGTKCNYA